MIKDIVSEKCPVCGEGHVFAKKGNPLLFQMPRMETNCKVCGHKFEREPGYFFGSMFISYAIAVAEMILVFLVTIFFYLIKNYNCYSLFTIGGTKSQPKLLCRPTYCAFL
mgnify:CR=1 FL=1